MTSPRFAVPLALLALALLLPAAAAATTRSATSGDVTATLSYTDNPDAASGDMRLTIVRAGQALVSSQLVDDPTCESPGACAPLPGGFGSRSPLVARDLDGDGEPEVVVDGYSGGAHCCDIAFVYRYTGSGYALAARNFADPGYRIAKLGRDTAFISADARFGYEFTAFAFSGMPVQIVRFDHGRFIDVTRRHPARVRADRRRWLRLYKRGRRHREDVRGVLAAYVADSYLLGARQKRTALHLVSQANRRHELRGSAPDIWPRDGRYVRALKRFLERSGYR